MAAPTPSQLQYAKHLLKQQGQAEPDWDAMTNVEVSELIDGLKKKRGRAVWYGNGQFSHWEKDGALRVVARYLEAKGTSRGWEHRKEQDERAENNIPPEHQLFWRKIKNMFKGTPDQRAEQFMEYLEAHPGENDELLQQHADKGAAKAIREWERKQREQGKLEQNCDKGQTKYEDAWYKEQERAKQEREKLKGLKDRADETCRACPTCEQTGEPVDDEVPFA